MGPNGPDQLGPYVMHPSMAPYVIPSPRAPYSVRVSSQSDSRVAAMLCTHYVYAHKHYVRNASKSYVWEICLVCGCLVDVEAYIVGRLCAPAAASQAVRAASSIAGLGYAFQQLSCGSWQRGCGSRQPGSFSWHRLRGRRRRRWPNI